LGISPTPHGSIGAVAHREAVRLYATTDVPGGTEATVLRGPNSLGLARVFAPGRHCHAVDV
jgi:hypothetical protein